MVYYSGCKDCEKRILGCHATCVEYSQFRDEVKRYNEKKREYQMCNAYSEGKLKMIRKAMKR